MVFVIATSVKFSMSSKRQLGARRLAAGLMLFLWVGTFALAASPQLHRLLHSDAQEAGHHCLITQIQQQPLLTGFVPVVVPAAPASCAELVCRAEFQLVPSRDYLLSPSRAPPSAIPTTAVVG
jgi:hypothetical protein